MTKRHGHVWTVAAFAAALLLAGAGCAPSAPPAPPPEAGVPSVRPVITGPAVEASAEERAAYGLPRQCAEGFPLPSGLRTDPKSPVVRGTSGGRAFVRVRLFTDRTIEALSAFFDEKFTAKGWGLRHTYDGPALVTIEYAVPGGSFDDANDVDKNKVEIASMAEGADAAGATGLTITCIAPR